MKGLNINVNIVKNSLATEQKVVVSISHEGTWKTEEYPCPGFKITKDVVATAVQNAIILLVKEED